MARQHAIFRQVAGGLGFGLARAEPQMVEYLFDDRSILDGCDQAHSLATSGIGKDIE